MGAWEERPLDPGWEMLPNGKGRVRPDGSIEWAEGQGPGGDLGTGDQAAQTRAELGQIDSQQANRWDKFGLSNRPPTPDEVAERGTKAWRDAFDREQNWLTAMAEHGASPEDLGLRAKVGQGLANFSRWGEITQNAKNLAYSGDWVDPNKYGANPGLAYRRPDAAPVDPNAPVDHWPGSNSSLMPNGGFGGSNHNGGWSETHGHGVQLPTTPTVAPGTFNNGVGTSVAPQYPQGPGNNTYNNFTPNQPARIVQPMNRNSSPTMGRGMVRRPLGGFGGGMS